VNDAGGVDIENAVDFGAAGSPAPQPAHTAACHEMLLRLAGHAPDELLTRCRTWLAQGRRQDVGRALTHVALARGLRVDAPDIDLLAVLLREAGADASVLALIEEVEPTGLMYGFAPTLALAADGLAGRLDPSDFWPGDGGPQAAAPHDGVCQAAIRFVADSTQAMALWRAWRFPVDGSPWPDPRRVYVIETDGDADPAAVTGAVQKALSSAGEDAPQVETYPIGAELPEYQRRARAFGALLWAREPDPGFRIAQLFPDEGIEDSADEDRPLLDEAERALLSAYLWAGEPLLVSDEPEADPLDPDGYEMVPMSVRTDGVWIWSDAVALCLDRHGLSPRSELVRQARSRGFVAPSVHGAIVYRALAALRNPDSQNLDYQYPDSQNPDFPS